MTRPGAVCPADGRDLDPVEWMPVEEVPAVVARARSAQSAWAALPLKERIARCTAFARRVLEERDEGARILADELGRGPADSILSEMTFVMDYAKGAAAVARQALAPQKIRLNFINFPGKRGTVEAVPRGVIAVIAPWNYPLLQLFKSLFPALLSGNAVVIKPSEHTPRSAIWLHGLLAEVLPPGLVGLCVGDGAVGAALLEADVDAVVFTGSTGTGRKIAVRCAERMIPCSIELGGKDAAIVLEDCDLERTVAGITQWTMQNAGQDCASIERIYVVDSIADAFVGRLKAALARLTVADGTREVPDIGPLQNEIQLEIVKRHVADARQKGAEVLAGGEPTGSGFGYRATLLDRCTAEMDVIAEETFGPVAAVVRVSDVEEAIRQANASRYGLSASVWTKDLVRGEAIARRLEAGLVYVNNHAFLGTVPSVPWTGVKDTGTGVAASAWSYETFVRRRTVLVDGSSDPDVFWKPANTDLVTLARSASQLALGYFGQVFTLLPLLGKRKAAIRELGRGE